MKMCIVKHKLEKIEQLKLKMNTKGRNSASLDAC